MISARTVIGLLQVLSLVAMMGCQRHKADLEKPFDAGLAAFERGHYDVALLDLEPRAHADDREAQFLIGLIYMNGSNVVNQDETRAQDFFTKAGNQGHFGAQTILGEMSLQNKKWKEAEEWYRKASREGDMEDFGFVNLNLILLKLSTFQYEAALSAFGLEDREEGQRRKREAERWKREADGWMMKTEGKGNPNVDFGLGKALEHQGEIDTAKKHYENAAATGHREAAYSLANIYLASGEGNSADVIKYLKMAADQGHVESCLFLGRIYHNIVQDNMSNKETSCLTEEKCVAESKKYLLEYLRLSDNTEEQFRSEAQFRLYQLLSEYGEKSDDAEAKLWLLKAADGSHPFPIALYVMVHKYSEEAIVRRDSQEVRKCEFECERMMEALLQLAELDDQKGPVHIEDGNGNPINVIRWAREYLGYTSHLPLIQDYVEAYRWYRLAGMNVPEKDVLMQMRGDDVHRAKELVQQWRPKKLSNYGSGFHIGGGYLLTNRHVIEPEGNRCEEVRVSTFRRTQIVKIGTETDEDLALLKMSLTETDKSLIKLPVIRPMPVAVTEKAYLFGYPLPGVLPSRGNFTMGEVTSYYPDGNFVHSADNHSGNSGGPILDESGAVIGVNVSKFLDRKRVGKDQELIDTAQRANRGIGYPYILRFLASPEGIQPGEERTYDEFRTLIHKKLSDDRKKLSDDLENVFKEPELSAAKFAFIISPLLLFLSESESWSSETFNSAWGELPMLLNHARFRGIETSLPKQTPEEIHDRAKGYTVPITCWQAL